MVIDIRHKLVERIDTDLFTAIYNQDLRAGLRLEDRRARILHSIGFSDRHLNIQDIDSDVLHLLIYDIS